MIRDVQLPAWSRHFGLGLLPHGPRAARLSLASAERDVSGSLSLVTKEGDTVTLSASFDASVTYAGLRRHGHREGGFRLASRDTHSSFSLQVQGDLSAQELADIREVVRRFMHDLRGLVRGRDESIADVADVNATTLTSISATATTQETLTLISVAGRGALRPAPALTVGEANGIQA